MTKAAKGIDRLRASAESTVAGREPNWNLRWLVLVDDGAEPVMWPWFGVLSYAVFFFGRRRSNAAMIMMIRASIPSPTRRDVERNPVGGAVVVVVVAVAGPTVKAESSVVIVVSSELMSELGAKFPEPSKRVQCSQYSL